MTQITLPLGIWFFDPTRPLGKPGGFGAVFLGHSENYGDLAVKKLHLSANEAAHREMRIANDLLGKSFEHVIPVFDAGEDAMTGSYFVVMPRAERSLQDEIDRRGRLTDVESVEVMISIISGLSEVSHLVHRDLKPGNVLLHGGQWKIADFGIARFLEEATSARTLRECLSPQYAAPEQWQYHRVSAATDIYALGCIGYALLTGAPPFTARSVEEVREKHLLAEPDDLPEVLPQLRTLLTTMLRKSRDARPSRDRVRYLLSSMLGPRAISESDERLAVADARVARKEAESDRRAWQDEEAVNRRLALLGTA